jgi:hypothetical protein
MYVVFLSQLCAVIESIGLTLLPQKLDFTDLPLDTRHIDGRIRNQRKGGQSLLGERRRITLKDFPKEWLPEPGLITVGMR